MKKRSKGNRNKLTQLKAEFLLRKKNQFFNV
jgi:hypothetical protein